MLQAVCHNCASRLAAVVQSVLPRGIRLTLFLHSHMFVLLFTRVDTDMHELNPTMVIFSSCAVMAVSEYGCPSAGKTAMQGGSSRKSGRCTCNRCLIVHPWPTAIPVWLLCMLFSSYLLTCIRLALNSHRQPQAEACKDKD